MACGSCSRLIRRTESAEGEGGFGYDWLNTGGEVYLYGVKEGHQATLVDNQGTEKGSLKVDASGEVSGLDLLKGDWEASKFG